MYVHVLRRVFALGMLGVLLTGGVALAQDAAHPQTKDAQTQGPEHQHDTSAAGGSSMTRDGSGTSWLPDESPMYASHRNANGWMLMLHASAFLQYLKETGNRGSDQFGSINWVMGMAQRKAGGGQLTLRGMMSAEPWTIAGCGYPDLLATGEECEREAIHDRQHPHDLFMELAAQYSHSIARGIQFQVYGGPVGEPALGPVAFMHRVSALSNALAPITHRWFDSTHITYGVVTGGMFSNKWKAEASVFNGREPDDDRTNFDFAAMDSWSGRFWFLPTSHVLPHGRERHENGARSQVGYHASPRQEVG